MLRGFKGLEDFQNKCRSSLMTTMAAIPTGTMKQTPAKEMGGVFALRVQTGLRADKQHTPTWICFPSEARMITPSQGLGSRYPKTRPNQTKNTLSLFGFLYSYSWKYLNIYSF